MTFYFPKRGPFEFFDALGHMPDYYNVGFEKILNKIYLKNVVQLQQSTSNLCGLFCANYMIKRYEGKTIMGILKDFNLQQKKRNDGLIVTKMKTLCIRKRQKRNKPLIVNKRRSLCHRKVPHVKHIIPFSFVVLFIVYIILQ